MLPPARQGGEAHALRGEREIVGRIGTATGEGHAIERALFWGRCVGGVVILVLGPVVTPQTPEVLLRALGLYFFAYAGVMLFLTSRARTERAQEQAAWLAHGFDTVGFLAALFLNATDPGWLVVYAAPLYVLVAVSRMGLLGGISAAGALAVAHVGLALWRQDALGIPFDAARTVVHISIYGLAALLTTAIDSEMRALRVRREVQVAVHEPLLRSLDDMGQGVLITEGDRAVYVSDGFAQIARCTRAAVTALPSVWELVPVDARDALHQQARALPAEGGMLRTQLARPDGAPTEVEIAFRRYRTEGRDRSVAIVRDVTVREMAMAELERSQRLESLGSLAGGIAHDFNNLLAVIMNNAHLALAAAQGRAVQREIEEIKDAAERGASLTRQMLVFARSARPRATAPIDVRREVTYAERLLRRTIGAAVQLEMDMASEVSGVLLEPGQLERILMNLVVNARDAMPRGGRVAIAVGDVKVGPSDVPTLAAGRYVRIAVRDQGAGMSAEVQRRAFEPFFSTKPKGQGTGLGLSTVYGIVHRAGGHLGLVSAPDAGTTVIVHLPAAAPVPSEAEAAASPVEARGSGERVLIVDDDDAVRRVAARILRQAGYAANEASLPSAALSSASEGLDLLVTDVILPEMSGRELAARMRELRPDLPVLFVSGHAPGPAEEDPELLAKPFTPDVLLARVREALRTPVGVA
jgi:signal transduction histidine kinase